MDIQTALSLLSWIFFALIQLFTSTLFQKSGSRMSVFCSSCLTKGAKYLSVPALITFQFHWRKNWSHKDEGSPVHHTAACWLSSVLVFLNIVLQI